MVKFTFAELILVLLQFVVSKILLHNQQQASSNPSDFNSETSKISKEAALRQQIERGVRAQIAAEQNTNTQVSLSTNDEAEVIVYQEEVVAKMTEDSADGVDSKPAPESSPEPSLDQEAQG